MNEAAAGIGIVFLLVGLVGFVFWVWTLIDAIKHTDHQWQAAGQNKILWIVLIVLLGWVGSLLYLFIPRPALKRTV